MKYIDKSDVMNWSGKAVYVTATMPYLLLLALIARALTLEGADDGLRYFFHPDWSLLLKAEVRTCLFDLQYGSYSIVGNLVHWNGMIIEIDDKEKKRASGDIK